MTEETTLKDGIEKDRAAREAAARVADYEHGWSADIEQEFAPKAKKALGSLDEVDPEILKVYEKLGIPIEEQKVLAGVEGSRKVAVDAVFDSVSVATTFRK